MMLDIDRSEHILDGEVLDDAASGGVGLIPVASTGLRSAKSAPSRPDASFVTQLIATAEQAPQTRSLRRASLADAQIAYGPHPRPRVGFRTWQVV